MELRPASHNPEHKPIQITKATTDFEIVGVVRWTHDARNGRHHRDKPEPSSRLRTAR